MQLFIILLHYLMGLQRDIFGYIMLLEKAVLYIELDEKYKKTVFNIYSVGDIICPTTLLRGIQF